MTLDEAIVFARHAPDDSASEWASFNLGELVTGPGDARSLIPIASSSSAAIRDRANGHAISSSAVTIAADQAAVERPGEVVDADVPVAGRNR